MLKFLWMLPLYIYLFHKMSHIHFFLAVSSVLEQKKRINFYKGFEQTDTHHMKYFSAQHGQRKTTTTNKPKKNMQHNKKLTKKQISSSKDKDKYECLTRKSTKCIL